MPQQSESAASSIFGGENREVLCCPECNLTQFRTLNDLCRRCHKKLSQPIPQAPQEPTTCARAVLTIGKNVHDVRRAKKLSQRALAARMDVPRTYISKIENDKAVPTLSSLERVAAALGVDVLILITNAEERLRCRMEREILEDPYLAEFVPLASWLSPFQRGNLLAFAERLSRGQKSLPI